MLRALAGLKPRRAAPQSPANEVWHPFCRMVRGAGRAIGIIAAVDLGDRMALSAHPGIIWGILALVGLTNATCYR